MKDLTKSKVSEKWSEWWEEGVSSTRKCEEHCLRLVVVFNKSALAYRPIYLFFNSCSLGKTDIFERTLRGAGVCFCKFYNPELFPIH